MAISKPPGSASVPSQSSANSNYTAVADPPNRTGRCNVVIFGESGAGKSSLVNLITRKDEAETSCDAKGCTDAVNEHEIWIQDKTLKMKLFDTPGLDEDPRGTVPDKEARRILKKLVQTLMKQGDIHLIIYCVRGEKLIRTLRRNYEFIQSQVKRKIPIVLVVTSLESYEPDMEEWWKLNENTISKFGMTFAGHACVTTGMITQSNVTERGRNQSHDAVCKLVEQCRLSDDTVIHTGPGSKNIVLFGLAGAGKSSLVNLMAGKNVARTSSDMRSCTLHWQKYAIKIDDESYNVFDTAALRSPQLGISQYFDAVENSYALIQNLERQGGIDLLLFCIRAGRLTPTLQTNYRLFNEFLCDKKVPIVVVITYLENEQGEMDDWWNRNRGVFDEQEVHVAGHACITAIRGNYPDRYAQSRNTIRSLVKEFTAAGQKGTWKGGDSTFVSFMRELKGLSVGEEKLRMENMVSHLTKRCGLSPGVAKQLADRIKNDVIEGDT
ncbi:P-loop containing nucleoside triphosphate hydrolase protein [Suillus subalutaceus]|uniref:P-loop containing nucleoside triphosphate hydrolase protein n=1 Tax=Suillus subalutaceus TaxID=48586 RepID=UPI001B86FB17|nr:P-loop containing nucleoside triphosphate hydrolase protein [Suillus subalutaceus]KAG1859580.1 P-loop containing nucleoside triphosphate hydrolase protein [Suillus subalutaceus]